MQGTKFAKADKNQLAGLFKYLDGCLEQIVKDNELGALKQALKVHLYMYTAALSDQSFNRTAQRMICTWLGITGTS